MIQEQLRRLHILLWHETQDYLYLSKVTLFCLINLQRKPLFCNRKHIWGTLLSLWKIFFKHMYNVIVVKSLLILDFRIYFELSILSCSLISSLIKAKVIYDSFKVEMRCNSCSPGQRHSWLCEVTIQGEGILSFQFAIPTEYRSSRISFGSSR